MGFGQLLYNLGLGAYHTGIKLSAPFNPKAKQWVAGREHWQQKLKQLLDGRPVVWVHCASLGEYEQGKPVIEAIEQAYPSKQVLVSFYSPSGYEVVKRREPQRAITYLPADSPKNAKEFLQITAPVLAIFIKYEFWYHYLMGLKVRSTPTLLVSGIFRPSQPFFKPWGALHREMMGAFSHFFVQDQPSAQLLNNLGIKHVTISGDTRFDRVNAILQNPVELPIIEQFATGNPVFIAGSTWPADEEILLPKLDDLLTQGWKVIIAPHDIHPAHIARLRQVLGNKAITYTQASSGAISPSHTMLVIDNVGLLAHAYKYATVAYIGGGFGKGIHNVLEAAANGLPIIFGLRYHKFKEARDLVDIGGAIPVGSYADFSNALDSLSKNKDNLERTANLCRAYVAQNTGATNSIMAQLPPLPN